MNTLYELDSGNVPTIEETAMRAVVVARDEWSRLEALAIQLNEVAPAPPGLHPSKRAEFAQAQHKEAKEATKAAQRAKKLYIAARQKAASN